MPVVACDEVKVCVPLPERLAALPVNAFAFDAAKLPLNSTVHGPPSAPVTMRSPDTGVVKAINAVCTVDAEALYAMFPVVSSPLPKSPVSVNVPPLGLPVSVTSCRSLVDAIAG